MTAFTVWPVYLGGEQRHRGEAVKATGRITPAQLEVHLRTGETRKAPEEVRGHDGEGKEGRNGQQGGKEGRSGAVGQYQASSFSSRFKNGQNVQTVQTAAQTLHRMHL